MRARALAVAGLVAGLSAPARAGGPTPFPLVDEGARATGGALVRCERVSDADGGEPRVCPLVVGVAAPVGRGLAVDVVGIPATSAGAGVRWRWARAVGPGVLGVTPWAAFVVGFPERESLDVGALDAWDPALALDGGAVRAGATVGWDEGAFRGALGLALHRVWGERLGGVWLGAASATITLGLHRRVWLVVDGELARPLGAGDRVFTSPLRYAEGPAFAVRSGLRGRLGPVRLGGLAEITDASGNPGLGVEVVGVW